MPVLIELLIHNVRSTHNVGSIYRTADGFGVKTIHISGYTPYARQIGDTRLPHIANKITAQISKVALGAEASLTTMLADDPIKLIHHKKSLGWRIVGLEQSNRSENLRYYTPHPKTLLIIGEEVSGIATDILEECDDIVEITMLGTKESFNVSVATGITLYGLSH